VITVSAQKEHRLAKETLADDSNYRKLIAVAWVLVNNNGSNELTIRQM
jgi:hypothetical protein